MELSQNALAKESIAYRFESQASIDDAKEQRDKEWREAYERLGQQAPERPEEPVDDGKTLYERLQIQKEKNTLEWDEKMKLGNQWRGLGPEELKFLADKAKEKREAEKKIEDQEKQELAEYRERLAAKQSSAPAPAIPGSSTAASASAPPKKMPPKAAKKDVKSLMKGMVVKKKPVAKTPGAAAAASASAVKEDGAAAATTATTAGAGTKRSVEEVAEKEAEEAEKKIKVDPAMYSTDTSASQ